MDRMGLKSVKFCDLQRIAYKEAWDLQWKLFRSVVDVKIANRNMPQAQQKPTSNYLLFCEHNPVYTIGKSGAMEHLLMNNESLKGKGIEFFQTNRGGDITYHGPGQLTGYLIFDLHNFFTDIGRYLRTMEEAVILTLEEYGLKGERINGLTGVWLDAGNPQKARKICAIGVHASRWVTMHGFGFNISTDLSYFEHIIPCGIADKGVTSLENEIGRVDFEEVKMILKEKIGELFSVEYTQTMPAIFS